MAEATRIAPATDRARHQRRAWWLQGFTLAWMCVECGVALASAWNAHSPSLLAFGADSFVELLSAGVVLLPHLPGSGFKRERADKLAGALLYLLAGVVIVIALLGLIFHVEPEVSRTGIAITTAALLVMPILAHLKRSEGRRTGNRAMVADAAQSATCAYLAFAVLLGLVLHAAFHVAAFDSGAALLAVPLLVREARAARRGEGCACAH